MGVGPGGGSEVSAAPGGCSVAGGIGISSLCSLFCASSPGGKAHPGRKDSDAIFMGGLEIEPYKEVDVR